MYGCRLINTLYAYIKIEFMSSGSSQLSLNYNQFIELYFSSTLVDLVWSNVVDFSKLNTELKKPQFNS